MRKILFSSRLLVHLNGVPHTKTKLIIGCEYPLGHIKAQKIARSALEHDFAPCIKDIIP